MGSIKIRSMLLFVFIVSLLIKCGSQEDDNSSPHILEIIIKEGGFISSNGQNMDGCEIASSIGRHYPRGVPSTSKIQSDSSVGMGVISCVIEQLGKAGVDTVLLEVESKIAQRYLIGERGNVLSIKVLPEEQIILSNDTLSGNEFKKSLIAKIVELANGQVIVSTTRQASFNYYKVVVEHVKMSVDDLMEIKAQDEFGKNYTDLDSIEQSKLAVKYAIEVKESACLCE